MRHAPTLATIVLVSLLAGCAAPSPAASPGAPATPSPGDALPARQIPWGFTDCEFVASLVGVPAAKLQPYLPPGFRSLSLQEVGLPGAPNPEADANFGFESFRCAKGVGLNENLSNMAYGSYYSAVEPPAALKRGTTYTFVKWDVLVPDAPRRALLRLYGMPAVDGSTTTPNAATVQGGPAHVQATLALNGTQVGSLDGVFSVPVAPGNFVEYTRVPGGFAAYQTNYTFSVGGIGAVRVTAAPGTMAAAVLGTSEVQGAGFGGVASFTGGWIELPATNATR